MRRFKVRATDIVFVGLSPILLLGLGWKSEFDARRFKVRTALFVVFGTEV